MDKIDIKLTWGTLVVNPDGSIDVLQSGFELHEPLEIRSYKDGEIAQSIKGNCFMITPGIER